MNDSTSSTARKVLSGGMSLMASQGLSMVLFFVAQRFILSELSKAENGVLMSERRIVDLLMLAVVDFGMNSVVMRRAITQPERAREIYSSAAGLRVLLWALSLGVVVAYSMVTQVSSLHVVIWAAYLLITARTGLLRYSFELSARSRLAFAGPTVASVMDAVLFAGLMWYNQHALTPTVIMTSYLVASVPGFVLMVVLDSGRSIRWKEIRVPEMGVILKESLPVFIAIGLLNIHDKIDVVLLSWFSSEAQVGIYGAAYVSLSPLTGTIPLAASMVIVPVVARYAAQGQQQCAAYAVTGLRFLAATAAVVSSMLTALAPLIIDLISRNRYADNIAEYVLFLWMPLPIFLLVYIQEVQVALGRQRRNLPIALLLALGSVVAGLVLIPWYDAFDQAALGAITARMIVTIISAGVAVALLRSVFPKKLPLLTIGSLLLVAVGSATASILLTRVAPMLMASAASGLVSGCLVFASGLLRWKDVQTLFEVFRSRTVPKHR